MPDLREELERLADRVDHEPSFQELRAGKERRDRRRVRGALVVGLCVALVGTLVAFSMLRPRRIPVGHAPTTVGPTPSVSPTPAPPDILTVACVGLETGTRIDRHEVAAGPSGVAVSIQPHDQQDQQLALVLDLRRRGPIQIVRGSTTTLPLPPGTHTVACVYEGDLVSGEATFEVTDPEGYYVAPVLTCNSRRVVTVLYDGSIWGPTPIDAARAVLSDRETDEVRIAPYPEGLPRQVILVREHEVLAAVNLRHRGGGWVVSSVQACPGALPSD